MRRATVRHGRPSGFAVGTGETGTTERTHTVFDTQMTIVGNVVDSPKLRRTKNGYTVATFRIASTPRRYDREQGAWVDGTTLFISVAAWRALGENVAESVHKGQPVVVTGRYCQRNYQQNEALRSAYELEATAVGHDLSRGVAQFAKTARPGTPSVERDADGVPEDQTAYYMEYADDDDAAGVQPVAEVDLQTGEVRELASIA